MFSSERFTCLSRSSRHKVEEIQRDQLSLLIKIFAFFLERDERFRRTKTSSIRTRTKHKRHHSKALFRVYRSMCVSFLCIHFYVHLKRVKDGQFSNAFTYIYSYFLLKIFTRFDTRKASAQITREKFNMNPGEKQAEIYTYEAPWLIYACNWSVRLRFFFFICVREALHVSLFFSLFLSLFM